MVFHWSLSDSKSPQVSRKYKLRILLKIGHNSLSTVYPPAFFRYFNCRIGGISQFLDKCKDFRPVMAFFFYFTLSGYKLVESV